MAQPTALNPDGGASVIVAARLPDADATRVAALAARRGVTRSAVFRELVRLSLDQLDRKRAGPPGKAADQGRR
jgi:hypothetical protein